MQFIDTLLNLSTLLDKNIDMLVLHHAVLASLLLAVVLFAESGLVVGFIFLPGDSLVFLSGALAASGALHTSFILPLLTVALLLAGQSAYWIGYFFRHKIRFKQDARIFKQAYYDQTLRFFRTHGDPAVLLTRFIPFVRSASTVIFGIIEMNRVRFTLFYSIGTVLWVTLYFSAGYFLGTIPFFKNNIPLLVCLLILAAAAIAGIRFLLVKKPA